MKYAVVILACVIAAVSAQGNRASAFASFGFPQQQQRYQPFQQQKYQPFQQNQYQRYQPKPVVQAVPVYQPIAQVVAAAPAAVPVIAKAVSDSRSASILKYGNEVNPEGFNYFYSTDDGINAQAEGHLRNLASDPNSNAVVQQGSFSWTSPEGKPIVISYIADENGYQPQGDALPVAPEVPAQIQRALAYTAKYLSPQK